jgi:prepilin-type processing-associated H-X9-DG protein
LAASCANNERQLGIVLRLYADDYKNWAPGSNPYHTGNTSGVTQINWLNMLGAPLMPDNWTYSPAVAMGNPALALPKYLDNFALTYCPDFNARSFADTKNYGFYGYGIYTPNHSEGISAWGAANTWYLDELVANFAHTLTNTPAYTNWLKLSGAKRPSRIPLLGDSYRLNGTTPYQSPSIESHYQANMLVTARGFINLRHNVAANTLFFDLHVGKVGQDKVFSDTAGGLDAKAYVLPNGELINR